MIVLIFVVKGFAPKFPKGEIVSVVVKLAIPNKIPKCLLVMVF